MGDPKHKGEFIENVDRVIAEQAKMSDDDWVQVATEGKHNFSLYRTVEALAKKVQYLEAELKKVSARLE